MAGRRLVEVENVNDFQNLFNLFLALESVLVGRHGDKEVGRLEHVRIVRDHHENVFLAEKGDRQGGAVENIGGFGQFLQKTLPDHKLGRFRLGGKDVEAVPARIGDADINPLHGFPSGLFPGLHHF